MAMIVKRGLFCGSVGEIFKMSFKEEKAILADGWTRGGRAMPSMIDAPFDQRPTKDTSDTTGYQGVFQSYRNVKTTVT